MLMPGNASRREILFVKDRDPVQEHWRGRSLSVDEAGARTGIETVLTTSQFEPFIAAMLSGRGSGEITPQEAARFFAALSAGHAHVALALDAEPQPRRSSEPAAAVRPADARAVRRLRHHRRDADSRRSANGEDAVRAQGPGQEPRDLERGADGRHARGPPRRLRVRGEGRDRSGAPRPRRRVVELPLDRRQRTERDDPALPGRRPADAGRRSPARRRRVQLRLHVRRHHADLSGQRHVLAAPEGRVPDRAAGAGRGHQGGQAWGVACRTSTRRRSRSSRPAC